MVVLAIALAGCAGAAEDAATDGIPREPPEVLYEYQERIDGDHQATWNVTIPAGYPDYRVDAWLFTEAPPIASEERFGQVRLTLQWPCDVHGVCMSDRYMLDCDGLVADVDECDLHTRQELQILGATSPPSNPDNDEDLRFSLELVDSHATFMVLVRQDA